MKARIIKTGETKELSMSYFSFDPDIETEYTDGGGNYYKESELEMLPQPVPDTATIEGWVARDKGGGVYLHSIQPTRGINEWHGDNLPRSLPLNSFPSVTWETGPKKVTIEITLSEE